MGLNKIVLKKLDMAKEARMARAKEQGFNTLRPLYHATGKDWESYDPDVMTRTWMGRGMHATKDKLAANRYASQFTKYDGDAPDPNGQHIRPVLMRVQNPADENTYKRVMDEVYESNPKYRMGDVESDRAINAKLSELGYDGIKYFDQYSGETTVALNPQDVRSVWAAFDPANIGKNDLLGYVNPRLLAPIAGGSAAAGGMMSEDAEAGVVTKALLNNKGLPVHPTVEGQQNFAKWFGESKAVDDQGRPVMVYHGTDAAGDFSTMKPGSWFTEHPKEAGAYTFVSNLAKREKSKGKYAVKTDDGFLEGQALEYFGALSDIEKPKVGKAYATDLGVVEYRGENKWSVYDNLLLDYDSYDNDMVDVVAGDYSKAANEQVIEYDRGVDEAYPGGDGGRIIPAYLSIKNPIVLSPFEADRLSRRLGMGDEEAIAKIEEYKAQGYDGIETTSDEATHFPQVRDDLGGIPKQWIAFDSNQIKSATGNSGNFDPSNPKMDGKATPAMLATTAAVGGAAVAAQNQWGDSPREQAVYQKYRENRASKKRAWELARQGGEALRTVAQGLVGAVGGAAFKMGGYLGEGIAPGFGSEAQGEALGNQFEAGMSYYPDGENIFLDRLTQEMAQFEKDMAPVKEPIARGLAPVMNALPNRTRKSIEIAKDYIVP